MPLLSRSRRAFTLRELIISLAILVVLLTIALVLLSRARDHARSYQDATQVRGIHQGMVMYGQGGPDNYVLPSWVDRGGTTVPEEGQAKDTTANIISILIYNGFFGPELCVSTAETNPNIRAMTNYQYSDPSTAITPAQALWDPAFSTDFTNGKVSNFSYAHLLPAGKARRSKWSNTFSATEPILANRGPRVSTVTFGADLLNPAITFDRTSNTLAIHGRRNTWEGHVVYNDNHINFEDSLAPPQAAREIALRRMIADCLFFDEPEDENENNAILGNFIKAGPEQADFQSIWD